jgi:hypothetical protein
LTDFLESRSHRCPALGGHAGGDVLLLAAARLDSAVRLREEFDLELLEAAAARVRALVQPQTWEAFQLMAVAGCSAAEAAARLGMTLAAAFKAKTRVKDLLQREMARLGKGAG